MKKSDEIFFGEKGMTSTSASHLANLARECADKLNSELEGINFVTEYVGTLKVTEGSTILKKGIDESFLNGITSKLDQIAKFYSFVAWVNEAIKVKNAELEYISNLDNREYCKLIGISYPEQSYPNTIKESDVLEKWSIKEREEYFNLETQASVIGKYIHPKGTFDVAKKHLRNKLNNPSELYHGENDTLLYRYEPSIEPSKVDEVFFNLQSKHREISSKLNALKFRIKSELNKMQLEENSESSKKSDDFYKTLAKIQNDLSNYKINESKRISALKIIIPNNLQETFDYLSSLK